MISASEDLWTVYKCLQAGADDYIFKPLKSAVIKNLWETVSRKRKEKRMVERIQTDKVYKTEMGEKVKQLSGNIHEMVQRVNEAVYTPIARIIKSISEVMSKFDIPEEAKQSLRSVVKDLGKSDLYRPAIGKALDPSAEENSMESLDVGFRQWLQYEYGYNWQDVEAKSPTFAATVPLSSASSSSQSPSTSSSKFEIPINSEFPTELYEKLEAYDFDLYALPDETALIPLIEHMFRHLGLLETFAIDEGKLRNFVIRARAEYRKENPYHSFRHAFDVTQVIFSLLTTGKAANILDPVEVLSLLISGIVHDMGHFGLNNAFLIATDHELAVRYNDVSVLENFHACQAFELLKRPECDILAGLGLAQYRELRKLIIKNILATDMGRHVELYNKIDATSHLFDATSVEHRHLLMQGIMKTADISNPAKPFHICKYWAELVQEEFFQQGDQEKEKVLPVSQFMDRERKSILPRMQMGFADFFVIPLFSTMLRLLPQMAAFVDQLKQNRITWETLSVEASNQ